MKKRKVISAVALSCLISMTPCLNLYATSPAPLPPDLHLVTPELNVIRGHAYQYAIEQAGYDFQHSSVQPGAGEAVGILAAMEAASQLADYKYQGTEEYDATIQYVKDRSGLPEELQGLNMELYFAKITYLDMQLGIYLDEMGNRVGNAVVEYTSEIDRAVRAWLSTVRDNVLGTPAYESFAITAEDVLRMGTYSGVDGAFLYSTSDRLNTTGVEYAHHYEITHVPDDAIIFTTNWYSPGADMVEYPTMLIIISREEPLIVGYSGDWYYKSESYGDAVLNRLEVKKASTSYNSSHSEFPEREGYRLYHLLLSPNTAYGYGLPSYYSPYLHLDMTESETYQWWTTQFKPGVAPGGYVLLNPNGQTQSVAGESYDYDSIADHCTAVTTTPPEIVPVPEPLPEPLPEHAPLYPPVSGLDTVPRPVSAPMPDYETGTGPDPVPDVKPDPDMPTVPDFPAVEGLRDKFPFCIPFDLADAFRLFIAEPETPVWEWGFYVPVMDREFTIVIDLTPFEGVAKLSRTLILISFVICLGVGTRNLIAH